LVIQFGTALLLSESSFKKAGSSLAIDRPKGELFKETDKPEEATSNGERLLQGGCPLQVGLTIWWRGTLRIECHLDGSGIKHTAGSHYGLSEIDERPEIASKILLNHHLSTDL